MHMARREVKLCLTSDGVLQCIHPTQMWAVHPFPMCTAGTVVKEGDEELGTGMH